MLILQSILTVTESCKSNINLMLDVAGLAEVDRDISGWWHRFIDNPARFCQRIGERLALRTNNARLDYRVDDK